MSRKLYGAAYCGLTASQKQVVENVGYRHPPYAPPDPALAVEIERARALVNEARAREEAARAAAY